MTGEETLQLIRLFVAVLGVTAILAVLARRFALPWSVALFVVGLAVGSFAGAPRFDVTPQLVLVVLLPGLIFEAAYKIDARVLRPSVVGVALLAGPGVIVVAVGVAAVLAVAVGIPPQTGFVVGAIVSATDPAAVIASFKRLRAPRRLATYVEAESLLNDGTGIVIFTIAVGAAVHPIAIPEAILSFVTIVVVSALIGAGAGAVASWLIVRVDDVLVQLTLSLVLAYGTYLAADAIGQSGIIAAAAAGLVLGNYGHRLGLTERTVAALDVVWEFLAFLLTAVVFLVVGVTIRLPDLAGDLAAIAWAVAAVVAIRAALVYGTIGALNRITERRLPRVPRAWQHVIFWSGLRGAVAVALALSLPIEFPSRSLIQSIVYGVVLFTLVVQATTADALMHRLGLRDRGPDEPVTAATA
ncbi:MAG: cation:proton antiporter [Chloroflexota bacterium]